MIVEEFDFKLPKGLIDANGEVHTQGKMKQLTARDEMIVQDLARRNPDSDLIFLLLVQAIAKLGTLNRVSAQQLEQLFLPDFIYLQNLFGSLQPQNLNTSGEL